MGRKMNPTTRNEIVTALKLISEGDWDGAHDIVQKRNDAAACRVHALLHRMEGDIGNASYWYRRAGESVPDVDTQRELEILLTEFAAC